MEKSKFKLALWTILLLTLAVVVIPALAAGTTFDFNALTLGPLDGQDGWSTVTYNHTYEVQVVDGTTDGIDGTPYLQFDAGGGGVGADGWRLNAFTPFDGTESYAYIQADVSSKVSWGVTFGLGYDSDGDGVRKTESSDLGIRLTATWGTSNNVYLDLPGGTQHVGTATRGTYTWCSYRLVMDLAANSGQGSGSAFYSLDAGATWQPVTGLQDVNLGLDTTATDAANPTLWDDLFFHFEGQTSELDNFTVGTLTLPNRCFVETTGDNVADFASSDASAVQTAVDNAGPDDLLKVAGTCAGVQSHSGHTQSVYLGQSVTVQGGYTTTNWLATPDPATHVTTVDAEDGGRVLYVPAGTTATVDGLTLTRGSADNGGGIYNAGTLTLTHSIVHANDATMYGGGMYNHGTSPTVTDVIFSNNSSSNFGGGMYNFGRTMNSSPTLTDVTFSYNTSGKSGGGMYNDGAFGNSSPTLTGVTFRGNSASQHGGGIFNYGGSGVSAPILTDVTFHDNSAGTGGAIRFYGDGGDVSATITNGLFDFNGASHISYDDGNAGTQPHFIHCTFYGATTQVVRITYFDSGQTPIDFTNCIFWGNNGDLANNDTALNVTHSIVEESGYTAGTGNVDADPHFTDAANDNFVPHYDSPAIDLGDNGVCPTTDLRGNLRDDWGCDAGAYEVQLSDTTMINKGVTGPGTYTFGPTLARIQVNNTGGCLNGLEVQRVAGDHVNATTPLQTGAYWIITPGGCTEGFDATLTLPFASANSTSRLCRWLGGTGPGYGWDCGDGSHTTFDDIDGWVTRSNVTGLSDWAVGNDVGPTAIAVQDFDALGTDLSALVVIPLIVLGTILVLRRTQR
jgi:predicted outer membrane repeat protein